LVTSPKEVVNPAIYPVCWVLRSIIPAILSVSTFKSARDCWVAPLCSCNSLIAVSLAVISPANLTSSYFKDATSPSTSPTLVVKDASSPGVPSSFKPKEFYNSRIF
jgi:hypothetical protein